MATLLSRGGAPLLLGFGSTWPPDLSGHGRQFTQRGGEGAEARARRARELRALLLESLPPDVLHQATGARCCASCTRDRRSCVELDAAQRYSAKRRAACVDSILPDVLRRL